MFFSRHASGQADRQKDRHAGKLIAILSSLTRGEATKLRRRQNLTALTTKTMRTSNVLRY